MWPPEKLLYEAKGKEDKWVVRIAKDDNGGGKELIWLIFGIYPLSSYPKDWVQYSTFYFRNSDNENKLKSVFDKLVILFKKMNDCSAKRLKPAINKILKENLDIEKALC